MYGILFRGCSYTQDVKLKSFRCVVNGCNVLPREDSILGHFRDTFPIGHDDLSDDSMWNILSYLPLNDLINLSMVNKFFNNAVKGILELYKLSFNIRLNISAYYPFCEEFNIESNFNDVTDYSQYQYFIVKAYEIIENFDTDYQECSNKGEIKKILQKYENVLKKYDNRKDGEEDSYYITPTLEKELLRIKHILFTTVHYKNKKYFIDDYSLTQSFDSPDTVTLKKLLSQSDLDDIREYKSIQRCLAEFKSQYSKKVLTCSRELIEEWKVKIDLNERVEDIWLDDNKNIIKISNNISDQIKLSFFLM